MAPGLDGHRLMGQDGVGQDERSAAGFGLPMAWGSRYSVSVRSCYDDFAGRGKSACDLVLREGHDVTWQSLRALTDPSFEGVRRTAVFQPHMQV